MHKEEAVRPEDVRALGAEVDSRGVLEPEWGADPAPAGSSVGRACRQSVCREVVLLAFHSAASMAGCRGDQVRYSATARQAELAQPELVLATELASRESPLRRTESRRSQNAKN
jgi:hypothetical protein